LGVLSVVRCNDVFDKVVQLPVSRPNGIENKIKVEFPACVSTVHGLQPALVRFDDEQSQHLQNVKNARYVGVNVFFLHKM